MTLLQVLAICLVAWISGLLFGISIYNLNRNK